MLDNIFKHQQHLMEKYHHIEKDNGLLQCGQVPVSLNDRFGQARLKDFAWRITEELGEAMEALILTQHDKVHCLEELIDGLHFLTEFSLLAGVDTALVAPGCPPGADQLRWVWAATRGTEPGDDLAAHVAKVVMHLGRTCNTLKNKPWKQTQQLTDVGIFHNCLYDTWEAYVMMLRGMGLPPEGIHELYMRKNAVNKFRQRSKY